MHRFMRGGIYIFVKLGSVSYYIRNGNWITNMFRPAGVSFLTDKGKRSVREPARRAEGLGRDATSGAIFSHTVRRAGKTHGL